MPLAPCRECGQAVSTEAPTCPGCGCPHPAAVLSSPTPGTAVTPDTTCPEERAEETHAPSAAISEPHSRMFGWLSRRWFLVACGAAVYTIGIGLKIDGHYGAASFAGETLVYAGLPALLLYALGLRRWPGATFAAFSVIVLLISLWTGHVRDNNAQEMKDGARRIATALREFQQQPSRPEPFRTGKPGDMATVADFWENALGEIDALGSTFERQLEPLRIESMMAPETFASPQTMQDAGRRVSEFGALLSAHETRLRQWQQDYVKGAHELPLSPAFRESFLKGFDSAARKSEADLERYFQIEDECIARLRALCELMRREYGHYEVVGDTVLFDRPEALAQYQSIIRDVVRLAGAEDKALAAMGQQLKAQADRLDSLAE